MTWSGTFVKKQEAFMGPDDLPTVFVVMPEEGRESSDLSVGGRVGSSAKGDAHACVESSQ
jgi:hypothetical protein